tara:strand:+ start:1326 stop:1811 length:486 start_codon:yes stop_codon:yes gene_type:complete
MSVSKEDVEDFCEEFQYPFIILYGLEKAFLGIAELYNSHKLLLYDREMIFHCFTDQGYPIDVIEEKFNKFFEFWKELQSQPEGVFSGQKEEIIKRHLPALVTRFKKGINPILENISYRESPHSEEKDLKLKEMLEEDERDSKTVLRETGDTLKSIQQSISD